MSDYKQALILGLVGYGALVAFFLGLIIVGCRRPKGQGAPGWRPDPAFDPALREDQQVAELDALYEMKAGVPRAW